MLNALDDTVLATIRRGILAIVGLGLSGMLIELWLINHREDSNQVIPLVVAAAALIVLAWVAIRPGLGILRAMQFMMLTCIGTGILGVTLHFQANAAFQRELDPTIAAGALIWKVVEATAPPALSPGLMVQLGLLGLVYTYKHPALRGEEFDGR
ncbi:MAG TPA: hypothetical protein VNJ02_04325 [Vicinamibacterales bacterium]|nr:hypothetical protein [Vicinamibacterales bacterium]